MPAALVSSRSARVRVSSVTLSCSSAGRTASTSASDFACTRHGKPSHVAQRTQRLLGASPLVEQHAAGRVERVQPGRREVVGELLDARLVADRGERVRRARARLGRVLAARPVHLVELLGLRVVGLELVVADRPRGRDAVVVRRARRSPPRAAGTARRRRASSRRRRSSAPAAERLAALVVPGVRATCSGRRRRRPPPTSSAARAAASRRARAAAPSCRTARAGARACHRRRRCRSRSRRSGSSRVFLRALGDDDPRRRLDQREVRERLREVPEVPAGVARRAPRRRGRAATPRAAAVPSGRAHAATHR